MKSVRYEIWNVAFKQINRQLVYEASLEVRTRMYRQQWDFLWEQIYSGVGLNLVRELLDYEISIVEELNEVPSEISSR